MWKRLLLIAIFSFTVNLLNAYLYISPFDHAYSDMRGYLERGYRIAVNDNFISFDAFYPPGTAFLYALVFKCFGFALGCHMIIIIQAAMIAGAAFITGLTARELFSTSRLPLIIALGVACYYPFISQASFFMSEPAFIFTGLLGQHLYIRSLRIGGNHRRFCYIGFLFAICLLIKGQGIGFVLACLACLIFRRASHLRPFAGTLVGSLTVVLLLQMFLNRAIASTPGFYLAANDSFNTYLGQSRREAVGCLDRKGGYFYIFHQNNAFFDHRLLIPVTLPTSILDREYFSEQTRSLWREDPWRQLVRSAHSVRELFSIIPHWPLRNVEHAQKHDVTPQWVALFLVSLPAIYSVVIAVRRRRFIFEVTFLLVPVLAMAGIAFLSMGQPRYLIPFHYNIFLLTIPAYLELRNLFSAKAE